MAAWAALALIGDSPLEVAGGVRRPLLRDVGRHWHGDTFLKAHSDALNSAEDSAESGDGAFLSTVELGEDNRTRRDGSRYTVKATPIENVLSTSGYSLMERGSENEAFASKRTETSVSCEVSYPGRYDESPLVTIASEEHLQESAVAIFIDERANWWVHGLQGGVSVPSTFLFGAEDTEGDYADIHPPPGTGKHKYTVIVYTGASQFGPMLSALVGTPWDNRDRAVGSLDAVEEDFRKANNRKPRELCRCSIEVSDEDIKATST